MSSTQVSDERAGQRSTGTPVDLKLEVVILPVADVERAKQFYEGLGWRLDADFNNGSVWRGVQMTPPGSPCSVIFGKGLTAAAPGSVQGNFLVVDDVEAARADLITRGANVSEIFHFNGGLYVDGTGREPGKDPQGHSYRSWASFSDPDGNSWMMQEITTRLPGRGLSNLDVASLTAFLKEAEERHGEFEKTGPAHHWSEWYGAYIVAREQGKTPEDAAAHGAQHVEKGHR